jgi:aspartate/methionine/tyrosine aminotransferase
MLMTIQLLRLKLVPLPLSPSDRFLPSLSHMRSLITPRTRAIALVSPNNPCGTIYPPDLLRSFYDLAREHGIALILDETYRDFVPPDENATGDARGKPHDLFDQPDWDETLISLFSFSKSYKVPGYRLGGMVASESLLEACRTVADCIQVGQVEGSRLQPAADPTPANYRSVLADFLNWPSPNCYPHYALHSFPPPPL